MEETKHLGNKAETYIHPTSLVHKSAQIDHGVFIGPFSIVGPDVCLGKNVVLKSNVVMEGHVSVGPNCEFYPFCSIGAPPQDRTYQGEPTRVIIGENNVFREYVSIHRGTTKDEGVTSIGDAGLFMAHVHLGHDVLVGDKVTMVNSVNLAGHVKVGDHCIISGGSNISQFISLGRGSYIGGASGVDKDIPPFCMAYGNRVKLKGVNIIGLRRHGKSRNVISEMVDFFKSMESSVYSPRAFVDHKDLMNDYLGNDLITEVAEFIKKSEVGIAQFLS